MYYQSELRQHYLTVIIMYIDIELQSNLQPYVLFDWRLIAERGLRCYGHFHRLHEESKTVASCEISFLIKASRHTFSFMANT